MIYPLWWDIKQSSTAKHDFEYNRGAENELLLIVIIGSMVIMLLSENECVIDLMALLTILGLFNSVISLQPVLLLINEINQDLKVRLKVQKVKCDVTAGGGRSSGEVH